MGEHRGASPHEHAGGEAEQEQRGRHHPGRHQGHLGRSGGDPVERVLEHPVQRRGDRRRPVGQPEGGGSSHQRPHLACDVSSHDPVERAGDHVEPERLVHPGGRHRESRLGHRRRAGQRHDGNSSRATVDHLRHDGGREAGPDASSRVHRVEDPHDAHVERLRVRVADRQGVADRDAEHLRCLVREGDLDRQQRTSRTHDVLVGPGGLGHAAGHPGQGAGAGRGHVRGPQPAVRPRCTVDEVGEPEQHGTLIR